MATRNKVSRADKYDWQAEDDLRTLIEAEKIRKDPARMKKAKECAKKRAQELMESAAAASSLASQE